jgi:hypothetical protein
MVVHRRLPPMSWDTPTRLALSEVTPMHHVAAQPLAPVIPLKSWRKNRLTQATEPRVPEPAPLYSLIALALVLHIPVTQGSVCGQCADNWPCSQVRLAYRLREGF